MCQNILANAKTISANNYDTIINAVQTSWNFRMIQHSYWRSSTIINWQHKKEINYQTTTWKKLLPTVIPNNIMLKSITTHKQLLLVIMNFTGRSVCVNITITLTFLWSVLLETGKFHPCNWRDICKFRK